MSTEPLQTHKVITITIKNGTTDGETAVDASGFNHFTFHADSAFDGASLTILRPLGGEAAGAYGALKGDTGTAIALTIALSERIAITTQEPSLAMASAGLFNVRSNASQSGSDSVISIEMSR